MDQNNKLEVLIIPDDIRYWFMRANSGLYYPDFKYNNFIAIAGNDVSLTDLNNIEEIYKGTRKIHKNRYKEIFQNAYRPKVDNESITPHSVSLRSNQNYTFIEEMKIGDLVIVPTVSSTHFMLGFVISDAFEGDIERGSLWDETENEQCEYNKYRRVWWFKEIAREELPSNLSGIIYSHQALTNLDNHGEQINSLISLIHIYKGQLNLTLRVNTADPIDSITWLDFQKIIVTGSGDLANQVYQKKSVESPGEIIIETIFDNWPAILTTYAILFGEVDYNGFKFKGIVTKFLPRTKRIEAEEERRLKLENDNLEADLNLKESETRKNNLESEKIKATIEELRSHEDLTTIELEKRTQLNNATSTPNEYNFGNEFDSIEKMELSTNEFGSEIAKKSQMDNLNL